MLAEQLQNTRPLIYMSLNKNSVYCVMPRSSKPPDTCKWDGPKWPGILQFSRIGFEETRTHDCNVFEEKYIAIFRWINKMKLSKIFVVEYGHGICDDSSTNNLMVFSLSSGFNCAFLVPDQVLNFYFQEKQSCQTDWKTEILVKRIHWNDWIVDGYYKEKSFEIIE